MSETKEQDLSGVTLLGNQNTKYQYQYDPSILEKFVKKFDNLGDDEQIISLDCFEFQSRCLTGDTLIDVACDETVYPHGVPIKDLVGTTGYVFGFDTDSGLPVCKPYKDVRKTGSNVPVVKITTYYYSSIPEPGVSRPKKYTTLRCTADHLILVEIHRGEYIWVKAGELEPGMHLVYNQHLGETIRGKSRHRLIASSVHNTPLWDMQGLDVHHKDGNHFNNEPGNLEIKTKHDHYHDHRSEQYGYDDSLDIDYLLSQYNSGATIAELAKEFDCDFGTIRDRLSPLVEIRSQPEQLHIRYHKLYDERDKEICELYDRGYTSYEIGEYLDIHSTTVLAVLRRCNKPVRGANDLRKWREANPLPPLNHRVVDVQFDGYEDVYNMEVDDIHNFFANNIIVHNCPKTGQPDFATIHISYIPGKSGLCVESKSLKLYLFSFQQTGEFHESCVHTILQDLVELLEPAYCEVYGDFNSRGGISILPFSVYADENHQDIKKARQLAMMQYNVGHRPRTGI